MLDNENTWDKLLKIKTTGRDDSNSDQYRYPYEPTPYSVLERLSNSGLIGKKDVVLDYFFNPFSVEILCKVIAAIITSYYENICISRRMEQH